jgi:mannose PTS system EIIA component
MRLVVSPSSFVFRKLNEKYELNLNSTDKGQRTKDKGRIYMSEAKKIGGVIVSHGLLATELVAAAKTVVSEVEHLEAVSIGWNDNVEKAKEEIARAIKKVSAGSGVLVLTDMFGGTPTNISAMFIAEGEVEIVTGVNLPMVIKLASQSREISLSEMAILVEEQGKQAIQRAGDLLIPQKIKKDA